MANVQSEKLMLAGFIQHPDTFFEYGDHLCVDDLTSEAAQMTFEVIKSLLIDKEVNKISKAKIMAEARSLGFGNFNAATRNGGAIDDIMAERLREDEVSFHFQAVKRESSICGFKTSCEDALQYLNSTNDSLSVIISTVEDMVVSNADILDGGEHSIKPLPESVWDFIDNMADDPGHMGFDLGLPVWTSRVGQVRNGSLTFVAATAKAGKSQFGLRQALTVAHKYKLPVLLVDSELNKPEQQIRMIGMLAKVPYEYIETGYWRLSAKELKGAGVEDECEINKILECGERLRDPRYRELIDNLPIDYFKVSGMGIQEAIPYMRRWLLRKVKPSPDAKFPQCLIVYDYIKLSTLQELQGSGLKEYQLHGLNVSALHDFVNKYHIPMITFGQTNREIDDSFDCVAGAKRIVENATSISLYKRKTDEELGMDPNGSHLMRVLGARFGRGTEGGYINLQADLSCGDFTELGMGTVNFADERARRLEEFRNRRRNGNDEE